MPPPSGKPDSMILGAFTLAVIIGGANFVAVRFSNRELAPFWGAGLRFGLAAILFILISVGLRLSWPRGRRLALTALYGALAFAVPYALMYWALTRTTAGPAAAVTAAIPLVTLLLAVALRTERFSARAGSGSLLVIVGITWMTTGPQQAAVPLGALLALVAATVAVGLSIILGKSISGHHPAMTNAVGMTVGASLLLAVSALAGEDRVLPRESEVVAAVAYLVTVGSVGLFVLVLLVVRRWTASASSYVFVLMPLATALLAAAIAGEPVSSRIAVGGALVMLGAWVGALSRPRGSAGMQKGQEAPRESNRDPRDERHSARGRS